MKTLPVLILSAGVMIATAVAALAERVPTQNWSVLAAEQAAGRQHLPLFPGAQEFGTDVD